MRTIRIGLAFSVILLALAAPSTAVETLTSDDVLVVRFELRPPYECVGGAICNPDVQDFTAGSFQVVQPVSERRARLYVDDVLLGTWIGPGNFTPTPGFEAPVTDGIWKDTGSPYNADQPTLIDFAPILAGSLDARIELRLGSGRLDYSDGFPGLVSRLLKASGPASGDFVVNGPVITSVGIIQDPEKFSVVDSTGADPDAAPGDGVCATSKGDCTLRAAIEEANAYPGPNIISVPAGSYPGVLTISDSVTIEGAGTGVTVIDGGGSGSVLTVSDGIVDLTGLSITGGSSAGDGGGIALQGGSLSLIEVEVYGNSAAGDGGGIHQADDSLLLIEDATVRNNTAGSSGGGIFATGSFSDLEIVSSSVHDNEATSGEGGGIRNGADLLLLLEVAIHGNNAQRGGGLVSDGSGTFVVNSHVYGNTAGEWAGGAVFLGFQLTLGGSTFDDNHSVSGAGALRLGGGVLAEILVSTVSGNSGLTGGGILLESPFSALLRDLTVTANQADTGGGLLLSSDLGMGSLQIANTIVAGNGATVLGPDCASEGGLVTLTSLGHNLVGDGSGCAFPATTGDQVGSAMSPIDPRLAPLAAPDGFPPVRDLLPGSPAIDQGSPEEPDSSDSACLGEDQVLTPRPLDGDGDGTARCDIGAVETSFVPVPVLGPAGLVALSLLLGAAGTALARGGSSRAGSFSRRS